MVSEIRGFTERKEVSLEPRGNTMSSKEFFLRKDYLETKPDGTEKAVNVRVDGSGYQKFDKDPRDTKGQWFRRALDDINSEAQIGIAKLDPRNP